MAKALGELRPVGDVILQDDLVFTIRPGDYETPDAWHQYAPSTDWAQGGPIIEREGISVMRVHKDWSLPWCADTHEQSFVNAPTALVAAMRSFTALKLGDEVEIPF